MLFILGDSEECFEIPRVAISREDIEDDDEWSSSFFVTFFTLDVGVIFSLPTFSESHGLNSAMPLTFHCESQLITDSPQGPSTTPHKPPVRPSLAALQSSSSLYHWVTTEKCDQS